MSYRDKVVGQVDGKDGKVLGEPMPCTYCGAITPHETLCTLGARCVSCYRNYCAIPAGFKWRAVPRNKARE